MFKGSKSIYLRDCHLMPMLHVSFGTSSIRIPRFPTDIRSYQRRLCLRMPIIERNRQVQGIREDGLTLFPESGNDLVNLRAWLWKRNKHRVALNDKAPATEYVWYDEYVSVDSIAVFGPGLDSSTMFRTMEEETPVIRRWGTRQPMPSCSP